MRPTWSQAAAIMRRHNTMTFKSLLACLALAFCWLAVWWRYQGAPVIAPSHYHPGLYHDFWSGLIALKTAMLRSAMLRWMHMHLLLCVLTPILLYIPISFYCVKELFECQFQGFILKIEKNIDFNQ